MAGLRLWLACIALASLVMGAAPATEQNGGADAKTYIVLTATWAKPAPFKFCSDWHASLLSNGTGHVLYNYEKVLNGFAARLSSAEADALRAKPGVLNVRRQVMYHLHTTHSPAFLGLPGGRLWRDSNRGRGVIIGMIDTGIWPESRSFGDDGMQRPPLRWKGSCVPDITCNNKIIGANFYVKGYHNEFGTTRQPDSPRDYEGHGSHTTSTAAGAHVRNVSVFGYASGNASGMAPEAWIAVYKVCWTKGCSDSDILAAMDDAVAQGVDVLSISLGTKLPVEYFMDGIAIAALGAAERGIFVALSAGNSGPATSTVTNTAPWVTTVAAADTDRRFPASVTLGDGTKLIGTSIYYAPSMPDRRPFPLLDASAAAVHGSLSAKFCLNGTLDPKLVAGKIVVCERGVIDRLPKGIIVKANGGAGMILVNDEADGYSVLSDPHVLPAVMLGYTDGLAVRKYLSKVRNPTAAISPPKTQLGARPAPYVASFSSRGPNSIQPQLLKPDISAPGVNIVAAYSQGTSISGVEGDNRVVPYNMLSGTSMSCPHVAGVAALVRAVRPTWSPAAVRSAMMTTAYVVANDGHEIRDGVTYRDASPYVYGAGHVDPRKVLDPGLVYDAGTEDYYAFLCSSNYTDEMLQTVSRKNITCAGRRRMASPGDLNYPSFVAVFDASTKSVTYHRTVTSVYGKPAIYRVKVAAPPGVKVTVKPHVLRFRGSGDKQSYAVTFNASYGELKPSPAGKFGAISWSDGRHVVRSSFAVGRSP